MPNIPAIHERSVCLYRLYVHYKGGLDKGLGFFQHCCDLGV